VEDYEKEEARMVAFRDSIEHLREYISKGYPAFSQDELAALLRHGHAIEGMRIRYIRGPQRKCLEIACRNLRKHRDWSVWIGFVLSASGAWSAHAWNMTKSLVLIEPNARQRPELYYGMEFIPAHKSLARLGLTAEEIKKFDAHADQYAFEYRRREKTGSEKSGTREGVVLCVRTTNPC
jgi:hypothetical protein